MNKDFADAWVAALREPDRRQTRGVLHKTDGINDSYCCLGVACKILAATFPDKVTAERVGGLVRYGVSGGGGSSYTLPIGMNNLVDASENWGDTAYYGHIEGSREWWENHEKWGEEYADLVKMVGGSLDSLAALNDNGMPFAAIADFIEAFYEQL
jgi:hypothetical protein